MSHHYSGPDASFPHGDARLDLTDLYAFPKPGRTGKAILIMNVHPSSSFNPRGATRQDPFASDALYEFKIDTDRDAVADIAYRVRFSPFTGGAQTATLRRVEGAQAAGTDDGGQIIVDGAPVSLDREARITEAGDHRFFAGWRSEPFFFDVEGALNNFQFHGQGFLHRQRRVQHCTGSTQLRARAQSGWPLGSDSRRRKWQLGSGRSWRAAFAIYLPSRRREECLPRRGTRGRRPFHRCLCALVGAHRRVFFGGSTAGSRDTAAGHRPV
jgi:hypothetical protein